MCCDVISEHAKVKAHKCRSVVSIECQSLTDDYSRLDHTVIERVMKLRFLADKAYNRPYFILFLEKVK